MDNVINLNEVFNDHSSAASSDDSKTSSVIHYKDASDQSQNSKNFRTPKTNHTSAMYDKSDHTKDNPRLKMIAGYDVVVTEHDPAGNPSKVIDPIRKVCYTYHFNKKGFPSSIEERPINSSTLIGKHNYCYDNENCLISHYDARTGHTYHTIYEDKTSSFICSNKTIKGIRLASKYTDLITRDALQRVSARNLTLNSASSPLITDNYSYLQNNDRETIFVKMLSQQVNSEMVCILYYTYDRRGNIETVSQNGNLQVKYTYDRMNRLVCEDNYEVMCRYQYTYDDTGNIAYKTIYTLSRDGLPYKLDNIVLYFYDHDWADRLISYEDNYGTDPEITYDSFGNLAKYRGNKLAWTINHRLASYGSNTFEYDATGIRYKKNSITYTLDGSKIVKEIDGSKTLIYYYGTSGVIGFNYNGTDYYYCRKSKTRSRDSFLFMIYDPFGDRPHLLISSADQNDRTRQGGFSPRRKAFYIESSKLTFFPNHMSQSLF